MHACISCLQYGKASRLDRSSTGLLKVAEDSIVEPIVLLFNQVLATGKSPRAWQTAAVICLFKKCDKHDWANYRLILLLSIFGKLFESVIATRISQLMNDQDLLSAA